MHCTGNAYGFCWRFSGLIMTVQTCVAATLWYLERVLTNALSSLWTIEILCATFAPIRLEVGVLSTSSVTSISTLIFRPLPNNVSRSLTFQAKPWRVFWTTCPEATLFSYSEFVSCKTVYVYVRMRVYVCT